VPLGQQRLPGQGHKGRARLQSYQVSPPVVYLIDCLHGIKMGHSSLVSASDMFTKRPLLVWVGLGIGISCEDRVTMERWHLCRCCEEFGTSGQNCKKTSFYLFAVHTLAKNTSRRRTRSVRDVIKVGLTMITNALVFEQIACESNEEQIANLEGTYSDIQICFQKVQ